MFAAAFVGAVVALTAPVAAVRDAAALLGEDPMVAVPEGKSLFPVAAAAGAVMRAARGRLGRPAVGVVAGWSHRPGLPRSMLPAWWVTGPSCATVAAG